MGSDQDRGEYVGDGCPRCYGAGEVFGINSMLPCDCRFGVALRADADQRRALDVSQTETLIQHPETGEFVRGAMVEAAYQRERWPAQDTAKDDPDWFWTLGYIVGKSLRSDVDDEHRLHHIEAGAALLANWHHAIKARIAAAQGEPVDGARSGGEGGAASASRPSADGSTPPVVPSSPAVQGSGIDGEIGAES